ncbi:MAG: hypothetical protein JST66_01155 [Bacteroidetes bacterium]|nr:hypothetical protein [Bacteroidota bacterium]
MSKQNHFDELARRKLEERQFPFDEAQWQAARQAIRAERNKRRAGGWALAGCVVLLAGLALLWWPAGEGDEHTITATDIPGQAPPEALAPNSTWTDGTDERTATTHAPGSPVTTAEELAAPTPMTPPVSDASSTEKAAAKSTTVALRTSPAPAGSPMPQHPGEHPSTTTVHAAPAITGTSTMDVTRPASPEAEHTSVAHVPASSDAGPGTEAAPQPTVGGSIAAATEPSLANDPPQDPLGPPAKEAVQQPGTVGTPAETPLAIVDSEAPTVEATATIAQEATARHTTDENADPATPSTTERTPPPATQDTIQPGSLATAAADSLPPAPGTPNDTTQAALPPALMLPLVAAPSPWELTAWGGALSSTSRYTGPDSEEWNNASSGARSSAFGLELMHMGRHFGIGTGVHYVTYAEQFDAEAAYRLSESWRRVYFLTPVDTAIFFITDTIDQGGELVYQGISRDTTVLVLGSRMENTVTATKQRDARRQLNRVSYVEVPLLLDAHVVCGRWSFGLIGGPTIGLLSGRYGALPNQANDGYSDLGDRAFRSLMFGYTARVYARFRVGDRWSLGLEPSLRGQLASAFSDGVLTRRTQALGGLLSFTYRLR